MNTEPIPYPFKEIRNILRLDTYCKGAWSLCYTTLWPGLHLDEKEQEVAKTFIAAYFDFAEDKPKCFVDFCERIILTGKYIKSKEIHLMPPPSVWFDLEYAAGFRASGKLLRAINAERQRYPRYLRHYSVAASQYLHFVMHPSQRVFDTFCSKLLKAHAPMLLQQFHKATLYFSNPKTISL
jgi:hypothetical protein